MAQDLKKLFKDNQRFTNESMPTGHEARFLRKLEEKLPEHPPKKDLGWLRMVASIILFIGLGFTGYKLMDSSNQDHEEPNEIALETTDNGLKSLGDVSPDLKKIEDYYVANINLELSKVEVTDDNKDLFDSYVFRLGELNKEYKRLSEELTENGPNELTVSALIDNLKLRLIML